MSPKTTARANLLVFQSGGPTAVINASLAGVIDEARRTGKVARVLGSRSGMEGILHDRLVDLSELREERIVRLRRTPSAALGTSRHRPSDADLERILEACSARNITAVVGIGGNDTADSVLRLSRLAESQGIELSAILAPKTIDNDLAGTDHCPGYGSIARFVALAVRDAAFDTMAMGQLYPVKIIETMGRNAGWVAAAGSLLFPVDEYRPIVCLPERPFADAAALAACVSEHLAAHGYAVLVVPETLRWADGQPAGGSEPIWIDAFGHSYFPGAGQAVSLLLSEALGVRARFDKPGTISRMAMHAVSEVDLREAEESSRYAVRQALAGVTGMMVAIHRESDDPYSIAFGLTPLDRVANVERHLPDDMIAGSGTDVTDAFRQYATPLIGSDISDYETLSGLPPG